jgi:hypothetical protein
MLTAAALAEREVTAATARTEPNNHTVFHERSPIQKWAYRVELAIAAVSRLRASDCADLSSPFLVYSENCGNRDGGQNTDDRDDDHQLDQGKPFCSFFMVWTPSG